VVQVFWVWCQRPGRYTISLVKEVVLIASQQHNISVFSLSFGISASNFKEKKLGAMLSDP
jgi:hypothetical protein